MDQEEDSFEVKRASLEPTSSPDSEEEVGIVSLCNQYKDKMRIDSCVLASDEEIIESMYQNLLRIVISMQIQGNNSVAASEIWCSDDDCKTPPSRLSNSKMSPETCPGAPMKLIKISRNIDSGLRRKLF